jgi:hypothetical protein
LGPLIIYEEIEVLIKRPLIGNKLVRQEAEAAVGTPTYKSYNFTILPNVLLQF